MRDTDPRHLHPAFRVLHYELVPEAARLGLHPYECGRTPTRQVELYARGRVIPGKKVTRAKAWGSKHQFGFADDFVFRVGGRWQWEEPKPGLWREFHRIAHGIGLVTLASEFPHVEHPVSIEDLQTGRYPVGGDATWEDWIEHNIETWGREPKSLEGIEHPGAPPMPSLDRPGLDDWEGLPPSPF